MKFFKTANILLCFGMFACGMHNKNAVTRTAEVSIPETKSPSQADSQRTLPSPPIVALTGAQDVTLYDPQDMKLSLGKLVSKGKMLIVMSKDECKDCSVDLFSKVPAQLQGCDVVKIMPRVHARSLAKADLETNKIYLSNMSSLGIFKRFGVDNLGSVGGFIVDSTGKVLGQAKSPVDLAGLLEVCR